MTKYNMNMYVFTTKYVVKNNSMIVRVIHDEDNDWQFLGGEDNLTESDAMIVSLGEIIQIDNTLLKVIDLPIGKEAIRNNINDNWKILDIKN